ncbi:MAG: alpha-ketoacid dehydrogenase subunit alpha/beta [Planctomycetota bacterium]
MPKHMYVDPLEVFRPETLSCPEIPSCQYKTTLAKERKALGDDGLVDVLADMVMIREFETMLEKIKLEGAYQGIAYNNPGPAHLSIGQEASAVGQALHLGVDDHIYGSHRSHGEIIAKGLSAIHKLPDDELMRIMENFEGGRALKVVERHFDGGVKEVATAFLIYGALAEIFARETGFNKGLGGSMHAFFTPFGIYPNNAIVGGSGDIAAGAALYKRVNNAPGIVIANIGDGSLGCGPVWEGMNFAAMAQYEQLWDDAHKGGLPIIFNIMNNHYGMGGQTRGETMGYDCVARIGAGVDPRAMNAERVNGYDPLAVADAVARKRELITQRIGPVLLETVTYRLAGHSPSDASSYRTKEEVAAWQEADAIKAYAAKLTKGKVIDAKRDASIRSETTELMKKVLTLAIDPEVSPYIQSERIGSLMYSNRKVERYGEGEPDLCCVDETNPRIKQIARKARFALDEQGKPLPKNKVYQLRDGIFEAMLHRYRIDPTLAAWGEENRDWGGAFACYRGLTEAVPYHRLFNSPISEGAIVGAGVGYALEGGRAVVELMYCDFLGRAGDEIFNQMAKWQSMSAGVLTMPLVLRISVGMKYGAQHSQDWSAMCAHMPGLKVAFPVTPYDAKGILNAALAGSDPVVLFESQRLYDIGEQFVVDGVPEDYYEVPEGQPAKRRDGSDVTIVTVGATLYRALEAARQLDALGVSAEVWDVRWLNPLDYQPLIDSVKRTGRLLVAGDACERGSFMQALAQTIGQGAFGQLDAPPVVVGSRNWICPAPELEASYFPQSEWIVDAVHENLLPIAGYRPTTNQSFAERLRRNAAGV